MKAAPVLGLVALIGLAACGGRGGVGDYSVRDFSRDYPSANARDVDRNRDGQITEAELEQALKRGLL